MGVIVNQENDKDELSRRINADLKNRQVATADIDGEPDTDAVEGSEYLKNTKKTSRWGWIWIVLIAGAIFSIISIVMF